MFREILSPNHKISLSPVFTTLHVVGLSLGLILFTNAFYEGFGIRWPGYIAYGIIGVLAVLLYRREINQYILAIEGSMLIFLTKSGLQEKRLFAMPAKAVTSLSPLGEDLPERPFERFCKINGPQKPWLLIGKTDAGKDCRVVFCPSEKAVRAIRESMGEVTGE